MKRVVISGINIFQGGALTIYKDCLRALVDYDIEVVALVYNKTLFSEFSNNSNLSFIEFKDAKKSWRRQLFYEYWYFKKLSKNLKADLWFSLNDITPNVVAGKRVVYCHNPSPFYKMSMWERYVEPIFFIFNMFYKFIYRINIGENSWVVVQQSWIRDRFHKMFHLKNVVVAYPDLANVRFSARTSGVKREGGPIFFYPAIPRVFKNFELICKACELLEERGVTNFSIYMTLDGSQGRYANSIVKQYAHLKNIHFIGKISKEEVYSYYAQADALLFPSKLETWGLPLTEFKGFNKPNPCCRFSVCT